MLSFLDFITKSREDFLTTIPCRSIGCTHLAELDFCASCAQASLLPEFFDTASDTDIDEQLPLIKRYPDHYRRVGDFEQIDAFAVLQMFNIQDPSGCIQHASRKLLMSGNAPETVYRDIREARDTLTRWIQLNQEIK